MVLGLKKTYGTLGDYLKTIRVKNKWTYAQVAEMVGTSKSYIWEIENNISSPNLAKARDIALVYGITLDSMGELI